MNNKSNKEFLTLHWRKKHAWYTTMIGTGGIRLAFKNFKIKQVVDDIGCLGKG